jgi:FtsP/CotA-like multicopper oxidase with cupredoxin domain
MTTPDDRLTLSRRHVMAGTGAVGAGIAAAIGLMANDSPHIPTAFAQDATPESSPNDFFEPMQYASEDGQLAVTLQAMSDETSTIARLGYNGTTPGPTLRVQPGDTLRVSLVNALPEMTNIHVHGLHVSPSGNSDNIFLHIDRGQTFNYEYAIPADHPPGIYWYHPHPHGHTAMQVANGLAGAIIVEGGLDDLPELAGLPERMMLIQGPLQGEARKALHLVNGQERPTVSIRPGETQRWRIANISANQFYQLQLVGHQLHQIATDGNPLPKVETMDVMLLGPGERAEVLVQGGAAGIYDLRSLAWSPDIPSQSQEQISLVTLISGGDPVEPMPLPTTLLPIRDLSDAEIDEYREITFKESSTGPAFNIDGKAFVMDRVDQVVKLDTVEEWTIRNESPEWHPFHIHVNDYQVMSVNGNAVPPRWEDTTLIPPHGEFVMRTHFKDFTGRFVYHCHILSHEDAGMMATIEVIE